MSTADIPVCKIDERRARLFDNPDWNGLDFLEVAADQRSLCVHFFGAIPEGLAPGNFSIRGGRRITGIRVTAVAIHEAGDDDLDNCLNLMLDRPGDFSTYSLCLEGVAGIDPRFACLDFSFKVDCSSTLDCGETPACPPLVYPPVGASFLAKDYASFLRVIYDRLALTMPEWRERHVPDIGVTLVELLAYVADQLSYHQDAVATEAYIDTARLRVSVRRHLRLIDYRMHEGLNARAFVTIDCDGNDPIPAGAAFHFEAGDEALPVIFEPIATRSDGTFRIRAALSELYFHDWGHGECCLPRGTTRATLVDREPGDGEGAPPPTLEPGDFLILEEVKGPLTGNPADSLPAHRHVVRLTKVERGRDELLDVPLLEVEWNADDALPFALCLSARSPAPECAPIADIAIARGNVVLVDHGATRGEDLPEVPWREIAGDCACDGSVIEVRREALPYAPALAGAPLVHAEPVARRASAAALLVRDPQAAMPQVVLDDPAEWTAALDLLGLDGEQRRFVAEIDDEGATNLRFGEGTHGRAPEPGRTLHARYRVGGGETGNVGAGAINRIVVTNGTVDAGLKVRNPLPSTGGQERQSVVEAKLLAPGTISARRERAIIAEDYAELALRDNAALQSAAGALRWTGSWHEVHVAVDPVGAADADADLCAAVRYSLGRYRRIGNDLAVVPGRQVPLFLRVKICVLPHHLRAHVAAVALDVLSNRAYRAGKTGLFHPDNLRLGESIDLSRIVAAVSAVEGVETVAIEALARLERPADTAALETGRLPIAPGEIARLDNDPDFPENGKVELKLGGGR
jgi:hypothetical protein